MYWSWLLLGAKRRLHIFYTLHFVQYESFRYTTRLLALESMIFNLIPCTYVFFASEYCTPPRFSSFDAAHKQASRI